MTSNSIKKELNNVLYGGFANIYDGKIILKNFLFNYY